MKKWRKKTAFSLVSTMLLTLVLYGCGGGTQESNTPPPQQNSETKSNEQLTGSSAERAIQAAKKYAGQTLTLTYEANLQAQSPLTMKKEWEEQTGVTLNVVELPFLDLYNKPMTAHLSGSAEYDLLAVSPSWIADLVNAGVIVDDITPYIDQFANKEDVQDVPKGYTELVKFNGKQVGFLTDGDALLLYYRKDWFENEENKKEFKDQYGYDLAVPKTWKEFNEITKFFTDKGAGKYYGFTAQRSPGQAYEWFLQEYGGRGGYYFDPETMQPLINNDIGVATLTSMVEQNKMMAPGIEKADFLAALTSWIKGEAAMLITWPPIGKWSEGYGEGQEALNWVPKTQVAGKVGYAIPPGGHSQFAGGFLLSVSNDSKNKELAYLFSQWYTSPEISKKWVSLPFSLGKPFRNSHFTDPDLKALFPSAGDWLATLQKASEAGTHPDILIPGGKEYMEAVDQAVSAAYAGMDPKQALDEAAAKWEAITDRLGRDSQKQAYVETLLPLEKQGVGPVEK